MTDASHISSDRIRSLVERIERLAEEKQTLTYDIKEVYSEAKAEGFDVKILRKIIARRKMDPHDLDEMAALIDLYESALIQPQLNLVKQ